MTERRGVLVAISIPIFTSQLEKSREATDLANLRSYYAEIAAALNSGKDVSRVGNNHRVLFSEDFSSPTGYYMYAIVDNVDIKQTQDDWQTTDFEIAGIKNEDSVSVIDPMVENWKSAIGTPCDVSYWFECENGGPLQLIKIEFSGADRIYG